MKALYFFIALLLHPFLSNANPPTTWRLPIGTSAFIPQVDLFGDYKAAIVKLEHGFDTNLKGFAFGGFGFAYDKDIDDLGLDMAPIPELGAGFTYFSPLGATNFELMTSVDISVAFSNIKDRSEIIINSRAIGLGGTVGILNRLKTITPFIGVRYFNAWLTVTDRIFDETIEDQTNTTSGIMSLETRLSSSSIFTIGVMLPFEEASPEVYWNVMFHLGSARPSSM